ncbi:unnamed protein product, partial [Oppiella nova]
SVGAVEGTIPFYKLDSRHRQLNKAKHILQTGEQEAYRFTFDVTHTPPALIVSPVLVTDEGWYRCRVDYKTRRTQSFSTYLEVIGNPSPALIWYHITNALEVIIDNTYDTNRTGITTNELHLRQLDRHDYRTRLTCRASSNGLYEPLERSVTIDMNLKPLSVKIVTQLTKPLIAGRLAEFRCRTQGSSPTAQIYWRIGEQELDYDPELSSTVYSGDEGNGSTESVVAFMPNHTHNDRQLICLARNRLIVNSTIEDMVWLTVHFPPIINISLETNHHSSGHTVEGDYIRVKCGVFANPWIASIEWALNGQRLRAPVLTDMNQTLVLDDIHRQHSGSYQCTAGNGIARTTSEVLVLTVYYPPVCRLGQQIYYNVVRNRVNTIRCSVDTKPVDSSLRFKWFVNISTEMFELKGTDVDRVDGDLTTSLAKYTPKTIMNYAIILCLAENSVGIQREPCVYYLSIQNGPPESVRNCEVTPKSHTKVLVDCMAGNSGGLRATHHLEVYHSLTEQLIANYSSLQPKFIVDSLTPHVDYNLVVYSANQKGNSAALTYPSVRLPVLESRSNFKTQKVIFTICVAIVVKIRQFIYEDEYKVCDQYEENKPDGEREDRDDSERIENSEQHNLMSEHREVDVDNGVIEHNASDEYNGRQKSRLNRLKRLTNRLKVTKCKALETTSVGMYRKVVDTEPKKIVTFATFEEFFDEINAETSSGQGGEPYEERAIDVPMDTTTRPHRHCNPIPMIYSQLQCHPTHRLLVQRYRCLTYRTVVSEV